MKYYGTKNDKDYGFYEENFENAIEISDEYWFELLEKQNNGKIIILFEDKPIAVDENNYEFYNNKWHKLSETEVKVRQLNIQNELKKQELQEQLNELDKKRIRALAEPSLMDNETTWLEYYNKQVSSIRSKLAKLS